MEVLFFIAVVLYMLSSVGYVTYFIFQIDRLQRIGYYLILLAFVGHTLLIVIPLIQSGHFPVRNLRETLLIAGWAVSGVFVLFQIRFNLKILGLYAAPLIALIMLAVSQVPDHPAEAQQMFKSFWLISHVVAVFIGDAAFAMACGLGILYLVQENAIKNKRTGFFFKRLPSLDLLDSAGYASIVIGFTLLTLGLITGFVYAKSVWGRFWSWDPKEVWAGITWLFYAALLHERLTVGWRGRRAAIMAIAGFAVLLFTFLGVNLFLKGHHGQFTQWRI